MAPHDEQLLAATRPAPGQWVPRPDLAQSCGLLVLLLELPCFFYAIALGLGMGHQVQSGDMAYIPALAVRARAYAAVILPILLASAVAEAIAVRGAGAEEEA